MNNAEEIIVESFAAQPASLRIALVTETFPPEVNGVAMTLGRLVEGMLQRGHALQVVRPRQPGVEAQGPRAGLDEVLSAGVPIPSYGNFRFGLPSKNRLLALWQQMRPDVVHVATEGPLGWSAVTAARKLQLPVTSSFHTNFDNYSGHYGLGLLKTPIDAYLRKLHNRTMATLVPTPAMVYALQARGYRNVSVLSRGVEIAQFSPARRSSALRASWGVGEQDVVALYVGRLAREKNVAAVLAAFAAIQARQPTAKLVLVGDGPLRKALQDSCPQAIFAGVRQGEELATYYASGDLFLFPSMTETYGNVVPEALASGLAVLSYAHAAAAHLIRQEHNGALVPLGEEAQFVQAAVALASHPQRLQALRLNAPDSVAHLGWAAVVDSFVGTLRTVVQCHGGHFSSLPAAQFVQPKPSVASSA
nr:glycosyltransferase family 1 protein [uncultured Albidiferax sp.]